MKTTFRVVVLVGILASGFATAEPHYFDASGKELPEYEPIYSALQVFFDDAVPKRISVTRHNAATSQFDVRFNTVLVSSSDKGNNCTVAHESSHLALASFTAGASTREEFRFFDEGFAKIFDAQICQRSENYKYLALRTAADFRKANDVSFEKTQKWSVYFGDPGRNGSSSVRWSAYQVGASFNYFVIDTYGMDSLIAFFKSVGEKKDLDTALKTTLKKDSAAVEKEWMAYLEQPLPFAGGARKIVKLTPEDGAKGVALSTTEISIEFDKPMANSYSLFTNCATGICYKDGSWKTPTLFVVTNVKLIPGHTYTLGIGNKKTGQQNFGAEGVPLSPVDWTFTAAAE